LAVPARTISHAAAAADIDGTICANVGCMSGIFAGARADGIGAIADSLRKTHRA